MAAFTIAFGSLAACRYTLIACNPLHGKCIPSLPEGLKFICPSLKPPSPSLLASFSSSRPSAQLHDVGLSDGAEPANARKPTTVGSAESGFKRPAVIEWNKDISNQVTLMGILGRPVEIKYLDTGKIVANSSLRVGRRKLTQEPEDMWFFLEFWDELAEIAVAHLKKLDHIFVSGSVFVVTYTGKDNLEKTLVKVTVKDLKYVRANSPYHKGNYMGQVSDKSTREEQWHEYFKNPAQWWDNRSKKVNDRAPDFSNKTTGFPLWIDGWSTPPWVKEQLEKGDLNNNFQEGGKPVSGHTSPIKTTRLAEQMWQDYFKDPSSWLDSRNNKTNPRFPDFKHKKTGEALWIESYSCPPWVKLQLAALDSKDQIMRRKEV